MGALRNMKDPWSSKSPSIYKGFFWNNTSTAYDHGGIHTNCSVGNRFFYLFTERVGLRVSTQVLSDIMFRAPESYEEYARELLSITRTYNVTDSCIECLRMCGLEDGRWSWWRYITHPLTTAEYVTHRVSAYILHCVGYFVHRHPAKATQTHKTTKTQDIPAGRR